MKDEILMLIPTLHLTGGAQDQLELNFPFKNIIL